MKIMIKMTDSQLRKIVEEYKKLKKEYPDLHIEHCLQQKSLKDAIKIAAQSVNHLNKVHSHQHRVGRNKLNAFADELASHELELKKAKNFDKVHKIISKIIMRGIGALTRYDIALRIGAKKEVFPDKIYLHAGTRVGAEKLLGKLKGREFIYKNELPNALKKSNLSSSELEDIFCCYIAKGKFCGCLSEKTDIC